MVHDQWFWQCSVIIGPNWSVVRMNMPPRSGTRWSTLWFLLSIQGIFDCFIERYIIYILYLFCNTQKSWVQRFRECAYHVDSQRYAIQRKYQRKLWIFIENSNIIWRDVLTLLNVKNHVNLNFKTDRVFCWYHDD